MTGWGQSFWGTGVWGGDGVLGTLDPPFPPGDTPVIIRRTPYSGQFDVSEDSVISVSIFDANYNLDTNETHIFIGGVLVYEGSTGFHNGYRGRVIYAAGVSTIEMVPPNGFTFGQSVTMRVTAQDTNLNYCVDSWQFTVRANPLCYTGLTALSIEQALQTPFDTFLDLEFFRKLLLDTCLRTQATATANRDNKAARVVYQLAFATELSTLQNPFSTRNKTALAATVCEKQNVRIIARTLDKYKTQLASAVNAFGTLNTFNVSYLQSFHDYADSSLYLYRVSLVANMLLFAKSTELLP